MSIEKIAITEAQAERLFRDEENDDFEHVEDGDWEDEGKYCNSFVVYKKKGTEDHYLLNVWRSGSYFSDYEYGYGTELIPVEKKEVMITQWVRRK